MDKPSRQLKPRRLGLECSTTGSPQQRKQELIRRCLTRVRKERDRKINELRTGTSPINFSSKRVICDIDPKQLLTEELLLSDKKPRKQETQVADIPDNSILDDTDMLEIERAIMEELRAAEEQLVEEYEEMVRLEEAETDALSEVLNAMELNEESGVQPVLCPICMNNNVAQLGTVIFCKCGLRIDTATEPVSLEQFRDRLSAALLGHAQQTSTEGGTVCKISSPRFAVQTSPGDFKFLMLDCLECGYSQIVI